MTQSKLFDFFQAEFFIPNSSEFSKEKNEKKKHSKNILVPVFLLSYLFKNLKRQTVKTFITVKTKHLNVTFKTKHLNVTFKNCVINLSTKKFSCST
jgi:hypothetical protein